MDRTRHARLGMLLGATAALALLLAACSSSGGGDSASGDADTPEGDVVMVDIAFDPDEITVTLGDEVVWVNDDTVQHTATRGVDGASDDGFDSGTMSQGDTFSWTADQEGEVAYTCTIHPQMNGTITVEPA